LPRKKRRTYAFQKAADGSFRRVMVEAAAEFEGSYEGFLNKATQAAERGMKLGAEDFERLNPGAAAFLKNANVFEKPYEFRLPAANVYVSNQPIPVVEPTGEVAVDAKALEELVAEEEGDGAGEGENGQGGPDMEVVDCYDCAWLSLTALSTVTCNLWL
jgi:hypothetical protein